VAGGQGGADLIGPAGRPAAWVLLGFAAAAYGCRMDPFEIGIFPGRTALLRTGSERGCPGCGVLGGTVQDLLYIGLTIVAFAVLWILVKGVERFER